MTLAQWHGFVDPVLRIMSDGHIRRNAEIRTAVAERVCLTEEDMAEVMSSGEARWANGINWAVFDHLDAHHRPRAVARDSAHYIDSPRWAAAGVAHVRVRNRVQVGRRVVVKKLDQNFFDNLGEPDGAAQ